MASSIYHTIAVQCLDLVRKEETAGEANIKPGHLLKFSSGELIKHNADTGVLSGKLVALESQTPDEESTAQIDIAYDDGDTVYYAVGRPGDVFYMWLAASQTAVKGVSQLVSNADGTLKVKTVDASTLENTVVGVAAEDKTTTGAAARVLVEIV